MSVVPTPAEVFCSYAHEDEAWRQKLETHLSLLKRQNLVSFWHDRLITPGTDWARTIDTHLETASVILLLVSAEFLASDYCVGIEMKRALERQEAGEARVVPILVRHVNWKDAPFAHLQALPTDVKPLSAWKDKDRALADVTAGIRRIIVEEVPRLSESAPRAALPAIWNVPYRRNSFFVGRDEMLSRVHIQLQAGHITMLSQPQAISGLGGIGKTQIAIEYAYRHSQEYQAVLWVHAETQETLISSYTAIAPLLKLLQSTAQDLEVTIQAVKSWLQTHSRWLLIVDNADNLALAHDFLPPSFDGHVLLTTRAQSVGKVAHQLEVGILSADQGTLFLLRRAGLLAPDALIEQTPSNDREQAHAIYHELGGLPLALDQAGAYIEETGCSLAEYMLLFHRRRRELLEKRGGPVKDDHPESVATTLLLSFARVQEKDPASADLLRFCAFLAPDTIPLEIFTQGASQGGAVLGPIVTDAFLFNQAIEVLKAYSLVQRDPATQTLSIHRLVQAVIQDSMTEQEQTQWRQQAILLLSTAFPYSWDDTWSQCSPLLPHAILAAQYIKLDQIGTSEEGYLLLKIAKYLSDRGHFREAEQFFKRAMSILEQVLGSEHFDIAFLFECLAWLYHAQGKYEQAEPLYLKALRIREQDLGLERPTFAFLLCNLAGVYFSQGKEEQAESLYQQALHIYELELNSKHFNTPTPINGLAQLYHAQGKYEQAESLYLRSIAFWEQRPGPKYYNNARSLEGLANLYQAQSKYEQAEPLYQQALHISEQALGSSHPFVADKLSRLAQLYSEEGKYEQAEPLFEQALHIWEQVDGPEASSVAFALDALANMYCSQGKYEQAEPLYKRVLSIMEKTLEPEHPDVASAFYSLAGLYYNQGKYEQAEPLYERAITLDPHQPTEYLYQGYVYLHLQKMNQARASFVRYAALQPENVNAQWMTIFASFDKRHPGPEIAERLEKIAEPDPQNDETYTCRGVALGLRGKPQEGLIELEQALQRDAENEDALFWKGMMCASLSRSTEAKESIERALQNGLPPLLLTPLYWLEQENPHFYREYAEPLLKQYEVL